jgi:IPT/TIG domain
MPTITDAEIGTEVATDGVLQSIAMTTPPSQYDLYDYLCLTDGERVLINMHISTSAIGTGSFLLSDGTIDFASLTVKDCPVGSVFDYELAEPPVLSSLSPDTAVAGASEEIVLHCTGTGFTRGTLIKFGSYDEPTDFVSDTEVTTVVKPALFVPDSVPVAVHTGSLVSSPVNFTFTEPPVEGKVAQKRK